MSSIPDDVLEFFEVGNIESETGFGLGCTRDDDGKDVNEWFELYAEEFPSLTLIDGYVQAIANNDEDDDEPIVYTQH